MTTNGPENGPENGPDETDAPPRRPVDFGDVLPEQTRDDTAEPWSVGEPDDDERLLREVPPHHG